MMERDSLLHRLPLELIIYIVQRLNAADTLALAVTCHWMRVALERGMSKLSMREKVRARKCLWFRRTYGVLAILLEKEERAIEATQREKSLTQDEDMSGVETK
jgi:hypothetical protein